MSISLSSLLSATISTSAQSQAQLRISSLQTTLTNNLNRQIAQLQAQSTDGSVTKVLQSQLVTLNAQNKANSQASSQLVQNGGFLSDLKLQLVALKTAAGAGDSVTFDKDLAAANKDVTNLNVVAIVPGLQPDGVTNLKLKGLGIKSSATYNLSTPTGQAQATTDVQSAQTLINQITAVTTQNQLIANSASNALTTQINEINRQLSKIGSDQATQLQTQVTKLQTREQSQFHIIELELGNSTNASSVLTSGATTLAAVLASQPGSRTAPKTNQFFGALATSVNIANTLNGTRLQGAARQPNGSTQERNSLTQAAAGALLNIFG